MEDNSKLLAEVAAAKEEFKSSIISSKKIGTDRYNYTKNKKSQADGSTANVVTIYDKANGAQFTISVNIASSIKRDKRMYTSDDRLDHLQAVVTEFLESIHEEL